MQIIISLAILALWALTSLLSRDAQPLPPRPVRGRSPEGPRPNPGLARNEPVGASSIQANTERLSGKMTESRFSTRPFESSLSDRSATGTGWRPSNDDIRILDSGPRGGRPLSGHTGATSQSAATPARGGRSQVSAGLAGSRFDGPYACNAD